MKSKDIFLGLKYVGEDLIEQAEYGTFSESRHPRKVRPLLIAALVALLLMLVGCAVVYVLKMESIKIGVSSAQRGYSLVDDTYVKGPHTVSTTALTLAGLEGSNTYKACADFFAFESEYIANGEKMAEAGALPENYWENYSHVMQDQERQLADKYGLKPEGQLLNFRTTRNLCNALGVERFTQTNSEILSAVRGGGCYDTGNFWLSIDFTFPENMGYEVLRTPGTLRWNRQDSFSRDYVTIVESGDWVERNYMTTSGSNVLILQSPSQELGYILCNRGDALISLQLNVNIELLSEDGGVVSAEYQHMTDKQIEMVADTIDFSIRPQIPTQADVEAQMDIPREATQNGYTLRVKSVDSDGYVARVLIGVTAPENAVLPATGSLIFGNTGSELLAPDGSYLDRNISIATVDDGDEKGNTTDLCMMISCANSHEEAPFVQGTTWNLYLVDIVHSEWSAETGMIHDTLVEGEWLFPITFDETNLNSREIELLSSPITAKASIGWSADGTNRMETFQITSIRLRSQSIKLTSDAGENADFFHCIGASSYVVMKDGSKVDIFNQDFMKPIDLELVDYLLLADGTQIPVTEN